MKDFNYHSAKDSKEASKLASSSSAFLAGGMTTIPSMKLGLATYKDLIDIISNVDKSLIKNIKIFDVYEGENIPSDKKSIALKVTIQSDYKTLNEKDLNEISQKIISNVEQKASAKLRS